MATANDEVIKEGLMTKRSQNKKRFTSINYKIRWFVLTRQFLVYYELENEVSYLYLQTFNNYYSNYLEIISDNLFYDKIF